MPIENPGQVNRAIYYLDERNQLCEPCRERLVPNVDMEPQDLSAGNENGSITHCTECVAFAAGIHPSLPRSIPSPETTLDNCPHCGGSRKLMHHTSCNRQDLH